MFQFYVKDNTREDISAIFESVISQSKLTSALSCTNDPIYYSLCKNKSTNITINNYMFIEDEVVIKPMPFDGIVMNYAIMEETDEVMSYFASIGMIGDWLIYYLNQRITQRELMLFRCRGLGIYIISTIRKITNEKGYKAICSTDKTNIASFNTLTTSGFVGYHTIDDITF